MDLRLFGAFTHKDADFQALSKKLEELLSVHTHVAQGLLVADL